MLKHGTWVNILSYIPRLFLHLRNKIDFFCPKRQQKALAAEAAATRPGTLWLSTFFIIIGSNIFVLTLSTNSLYLHVPCFLSTERSQTWNVLTKTCF